MSYTQRLEDCLTDTARQVHKAPVQNLSTNMVRKDSSRWSNPVDGDRSRVRTVYTPPHLKHQHRRDHLISTGEWTGGDN